MKIYSPAEGYTAKDQYGDIVLDFQDGVAEFSDDLPPGVRQYLAGAGYGLDADPVRPETPEPADPRGLSDGTVGTRLRDAAVDPELGDFLAPVNAGEANPHGPLVVAPEVHASGPAGIRPGVVHVEDPVKQDARERAFAEARLVEGATAEANAAEVEVEAPVSEVPSRSDNKAAWVEYAVAQGTDQDEAKAMTKAALVDRFGA